MTLPIVITTYMREERDQQVTFYGIPEKHRKNVYVFCREARADLLKENNPEMNVITIPDDTDVGIARTRQVVLDTMLDRFGHTRVWMMDDRLKFGVRDMETMKVKNITTEEQFDWMYDQIDQLSQQYPMVSLATKKDISLANGDGTPKRGIKIAGRAYANYALQLDTLRENGIRFDGMWRENENIRMMEDFYVVCSLLDKGLPNVLFQDAGFEHKVGEAGGNSTIRSYEMQENCCRFLASKFPAYVKIVQKDNSWGDLKDGRIDVTVQWKRLYEAGLAKQESQSLEDFFS